MERSFQSKLTSTITSGAMQANAPSLYAKLLPPPSSDTSSAIGTRTSNDDESHQRLMREERVKAAVLKGADRGGRVVAGDWAAQRVVAAGCGG